MDQLHGTKDLGSNSDIVKFMNFISSKSFCLLLCLFLLPGGRFLTSV